MKIKLITVGSPHLNFAKDGIAEYAKRISRFADLTLLHIKENKDTDAKIMKNIANSFCILLDEKGRQFSSHQLSDFLEKKKIQGLDISFVIGGPCGHSQKVRDRGDFSLSLSELTFPHDVAMMLVLETLYRSCTISAGHPYHRD